MSQSYDIAVIGGGAAGLSLLYALHLQGVLGDYSVILVEPEAKNDNDRTWCFWTDKSDPAWQMFSHCVSKTWSHIDAAPGQRQALKPYEYAQIRSKDFYRFVKDALLNYPRLQVVAARLKSLNSGASQPLQGILENGQHFKADLVFDSRPPKLDDPELIWQSFVGYRIVAEGANFETQVCRLMDFEVPQSEGLQFMYFLPTSSDEALIEFTRFGRAVLEEDESRVVIEEYLERLGVNDYTILEREINKIPMSLTLNSSAKKHRPEARYIPIGVRAGNVKASTGFAFKKISQHSWAIAQAIKRREAIPTAQHPLQFWLYDDLLLNLFKRDKAIILKVFKRLFQKHPIERILRFIDEKSHFYEDLIIMAKMPWSPFFWSIGRSIRKRL